MRSRKIKIARISFEITIWRGQLSSYSTHQRAFW